VRPSLTPIEPLSQVVFVHDYFQLFFDDEVFSVYNPVVLVLQGEKLHQPSPGFCDALVALIGQRAEAMPTEPDCLLALSFARGAKLLVLEAASASGGAEAFSFKTSTGPLVVKHNA